MKVLWFEVTMPNRYKNGNIPVGGWQDSLETVVRAHGDVELFIAFEGISGNKKKNIDGVTYIPIVPHYSIVEKLRNGWTHKYSCDTLLKLAVDVVRDVSPDIIQVFGSEWCWGQIQLYTSIPVVIHMQGSIPPYYNARYPPTYGDFDMIKSMGWNILKQMHGYFRRHKDWTRIAQEEKTLRCVNYYMGRTTWDKNIVRLYNSTSRYFYCSEVLRQSFYHSEKVWSAPNNECKRIVSVGAGILKGIDTILHTAHMLKERGVNFEWFVCGDLLCRNMIEQKEHLKFNDNNVKLLGYVDPYKLSQLLLSSDMYVHTSYIDNSPNAVCEAQLLGMPIIATYTGGIPSLIENGVNGILVATNDPFTTTVTIMDLFRDKNLCIRLGAAGRKTAIKRHNPETIYRDLMTCYKNILNEK